MFVQIANMYTGRSESMSVNPPAPLTVARRLPPADGSLLFIPFVLNGYQFCFGDGGVAHIRYKKYRITVTNLTAPLNPNVVFRGRNIFLNYDGQRAYMYVCMYVYEILLVVEEGRP